MDGNEGAISLRPISYKRHRFPPEIISHAVWLYFRFPLSLRLVEEMLLERGISVSYETIRRWALKLGADYARRLKRKAPARSDVWHLDEVVISINGEKRYPGRRRSDPRPPSGGNRHLLRRNWLSRRQEKLVVVGASST